MYTYPLWQRNSIPRHVCSAVERSTSVWGMSDLLLVHFGCARDNWYFCSSSQLIEITVYIMPSLKWIAFLNGKILYIIYTSISYKRSERCYSWICVSVQKQDYCMSIFVVCTESRCVWNHSLDALMLVVIYWFWKCMIIANSLFMFLLSLSLSPLCLSIFISLFFLSARCGVCACLTCWLACVCVCVCVLTWKVLIERYCWTCCVV